MSTELFESIELQDLKRVAELLAQGDDPNMILQEPPHWRPLDAALEEVTWYEGPMAIVQILLHSGANPNAWDHEHTSTPLHLAMRANNREAIQLMIEAGADPNLMSEEGESALRWAVEESDFEMAKLFLHFGADKTINEFGPPCGDTPLTMAARKLDVKMIELLLSAGADPNALDEDNRTALMRLPPRNISNPNIWDKAVNLLTRKTRKADKL